jgi:hypothetical protein
LNAPGAQEIEKYIRQGPLHTLHFAKDFLHLLSLWRIYNAYLLKFLFVCCIEATENAPGVWDGDFESIDNGPLRNRYRENLLPSDLNVEVEVRDQ